MPQIMDDPQSFVAIWNRIHKYPDGQQVVDVVEVSALSHIPSHFVVDAVDMLRPTSDFCLYTCFVQFLPQYLRNLGYEALALCPATSYQASDFVVLSWLQVTES